MRLECVTKDTMDLWLTEGKTYYGEIVVSPREFSGGEWVYIYKADDGYPAYVRKFQVKMYQEFSQDTNV